MQKYLRLSVKEKIKENYNEEGALEAPVVLVRNGPKCRGLAQAEVLVYSNDFPNPSAPTWRSTCSGILCLTRVHLISKTVLFRPMPVNLSKTSHKCQSTTIL